MGRMCALSLREPSALGDFSGLGIRDAVGGKREDYGRGFGALNREFGYPYIAVLRAVVILQPFQDRLPVPRRDLARRGFQARVIADDLDQFDSLGNGAGHVGMRRDGSRWHGGV